MKHYKRLIKEGWSAFSFDEQMGNIGMDILRAIDWRDKNKENSKNFLEMGLILFDGTIADLKNKEKRLELIEVRKKLMDYFSSNNFSKLKDKEWEDYFYKFAWIAALEREKKYSNI